MTLEVRQDSCEFLPCQAKNFSRQSAYRHLLVQLLKFHHFSDTQALVHAQSQEGGQQRQIRPQLAADADPDAVGVGRVEIKECRRACKSVMQELQEEGVPFNPDTEIGIMIE